MASYRTIHSRRRHCAWDRGIEPVARIEPGTFLEFDVVDASNGVIDRSSTAERLADIEPERVNPVTGPVYIEGAAPGDSLIVTIEGFETSGWGWTAIIPGFGLLADQFPDPFLHLSVYDDDRVEFTSDIHLPTRPFPGTIGVAPAQPGTHPMIPPHRHGGNIDVRLGEGVNMPNWLFTVHLPRTILT
jgi:formamidase